MSKIGIGPDHSTVAEIDVDVMLSPAIVPDLISLEVAMDGFSRLGFPECIDDLLVGHAWSDVLVEVALERLPVPLVLARSAGQKAKECHRESDNPFHKLSFLGVV